MDANQRFDRIDEKLETLIDQVGRLTEGLVDLRLTVERQADTVDRLLSEGLADIKATIERQMIVAERQAETVDRQAATVDRLVKIVDNLLQRTD